MALNPSRRRLVAALGSGILFVHDVGYRLAPQLGLTGPNAPDAHGYLELAFPVVGLIVVVALSEFLLRLRDRAQVSASDTRQVSNLWQPIALALFCTVMLQESAEIAVSTAPAAGALGSLAGFALIACGLSVIAGLVVACLVRGARYIEALVARIAAARPARANRAFHARTPRSEHRPIFGALADHLASRAPPALIA